jgi:hypothetical protein
VRRPGAVAIIAVSAMAATSWLLTQPPANPQVTLTEDAFHTVFAEEWLRISVADQKSICLLYFSDRAAFIPMMQRDFEGITGLATDSNWYRQAMDQACDYSL